MDAATLLIAALSAFAVVASVGVLLTRDNFYAALYMAVAMVSIAAVYAVFNLQPVVVLIVLIFVGAVGIVTVAVAATYRFATPRKVDLLWVAPVVGVFGIVAYFYYHLVSGDIKITPNPDSFASISTDYFFVILFLVSLMILMMLSAIKLAWRGET
jgi:NADH-quinone oxidoreductase subunit J